MIGSSVMKCTAIRHTHVRKLRKTVQRKNEKKEKKAEGNKENESSHVCARNTNAKNKLSLFSKCLTYNI